MSISNATDLAIAIQNWTDNSDVAGYTGDLIRLAEARINRRVRSQAMLASDTAQTTAGTNYIATPSGFVETFLLYDSATTPWRVLQHVSPEVLFDGVYASDQDEPTTYAVIGSNVYLWPTPGAQYSLVHHYYQASDITNGGSTALIVQHPDLYLFGALVEEAHLRQEDDTPRFAVWQARFEAAVAEANAESARRQVMGNQSSAPRLL